MILAIPMGLAAIFTAIAALRSIHKAPSIKRGVGWAVSALVLGTVTIAAGSAVILVLFLQQFAPDGGRHRGWDPDRHAQQMEGSNRMGDGPTADFTSNLPVVVLNTGGHSVTKRRQTLVQARFYEPNGGRVSLRDKPAYDGLAAINFRGFSTLHLPKRSYTLHTLDTQTNQIKVSLLGLPAEEDWVLYAPYEDKTLMRDVLAYELARAMGHYAPRTRYVELFIAGSGREPSMRDYAGIYVLVEKIKRGRDRVDIAKLQPDDTSEPDISGGYILQRDHSEGSEAKFRTSHGGPYSFVYPKAANISQEQKRWIRQYLNSFETALYGANFADAKRGYAAYLDVPSFIDAHWLVEISKNVDGFRYSSFMTKDRGGKLQLGPAWDWNRSFGNANYYGGDHPKGWYWTNLRPNEISWFARLREDPAFVQACASRWKELRKDVFDPKKINARIDAHAAELKEAQERNFRRWPILGQQVTCNSYVGDSFEDEVQWLKKWIGRRIAWIDSQVDKL